MVAKNERLRARNFLAFEFASSSPLKLRPLFFPLIVEGSKGKIEMTDLLVCNKTQFFSICSSEKMNRHQ